MKQQKRKGFTLVELLVVIAILAVLATVSIVGYTQFIKKARISNDTALTRQVNDLLMANEILDGPAATMHDALAIIEENGFVIEKLTPTAAGYSFIWDSQTNRFLLLNEELAVVAPAGETPVPERSFAVAHNETELTTWQNKGFNVYLAKDYSGSKTIAVSTGIDVGSNADIESITHTNETPNHDVILRTNGGNLVANDTTNSKQYHYGKLDTADITTGKDCFYTYGTILQMKLNAGKVVAGNNGTILALEISADNKDNCFTEEVGNGSITIVTSLDNSITIDNNTTSIDGFDIVKVGKGTATNVYTSDAGTISFAQALLDGYYGSINGKTIVFTESIDEKLEFGRPTKFAGSNTIYRFGSYDDAAMTYEEFDAHRKQESWTQTPHYERSVENVTFSTSTTNVLLSDLVFHGGDHVHGSENAPVYDIVTCSLSYSAGYYHKLSAKSIEFVGITFNKQVNMATSASGTIFDGITFSNCSFTTGGIDPSNKAAIRFYAEDSLTAMGTVKNLVVDNCTFENCYQGVYANGANNITVTNCTFTNLGHNAVAIQTGNKHNAENPVDYGNVVITNNKFSEMHNRVIRFGHVGATSITIKNNRVMDDGVSTEEAMKAESLAEGITYDISGNIWKGYLPAANSELQDR